MTKNGAARAQAPKADDAGGDLVVKDAGNVPDFMREMVEGDLGLGTSSAAEDNIVPLLKVLQSNNPQVKPRDPDYVEGASAGDFYFKGLGIVAPGDGGVVVVPCAFVKAVVEWVSPEPGSGYVGQHASWPEDTEDYPDPRDPSRVMKRRRGNKHHLEETRYHYLLVSVPGSSQHVPYVMPFKSTGHTTSREWMFMMNAYKTREGKTLPSFHRRYHLSTVPRKNAKGEWYAVKVSPLGCVDSEAEYLAARSLALSVSTGELVADRDDEAPEAGGPQGGAGVDTGAAAKHI